MQKKKLFTPEALVNIPSTWCLKGCVLERCSQGFVKSHAVQVG